MLQQIPRRKTRGKLSQEAANRNLENRQTMTSEYLRPLFDTPQQVKQTLRATGLDESQDNARSKLRGMNPVAIQGGRFDRIVRFTRTHGLTTLLMSNMLWGSGEDTHIDRSTWPESPVMVSNTDAVIESFWNFKLGYASRWTWSADPANELVRQKAWNRFQLNWDVNHVPGRVTVERDYDLYVKGFESLILKTQFPPDVTASVSVVIDGERKDIARDQPGSIDNQEITGALDGERLERVIIEYSTDVPGRKELVLRWLLVSREGIPWVGPAPDFTRFLVHSAIDDFSPGLNLLHDDADIARLREMSQQPEWREHWKKDREAAATVLAGDTNYPIRKYTLYAEGHAGRVSAERPLEFNLALKAALIGLVAKDESQIRFAAKQAIRLALTERWEDSFEAHFPGPIWDDSAFPENVATIQAALLLDLCWNWLTPEGRALIAQAIREKGLPELETHRDAYANQGVRFHRGLLLGKLALSKAGLGMPLSQEDVCSEIASMNQRLDPLIRQDGTYLEGVGYGLGTSKATFMTYVAASRVLGVSIEELVHPRMLAGMRFAAELNKAIPSEAALFLVDTLQANEFARWAQTDSLVAGAFPEMTNFGLQWLWYDPAHETEGEDSAFPEFSLYPDGGWVFARDLDQSQVAINFESGLWGGYGHSWTRKNSIEVDAWGETLLVRRFHVGYKDGRYPETARTAAYNTFTPGLRNQDIEAPAGRGSDLHIAQNLSVTTVIEADNATAWKEGVCLARRRVLFVRPHTLLVEDTVRLDQAEAGIQNWNSLIPFRRDTEETAHLETEKGILRISLLTPSDTPMRIAEDSVHREITRGEVTIVPVYRTAFIAPPAMSHRFLTVITLTPKDGISNSPDVHTEGDNAEFLTITHGDQVTRVARDPAFWERLPGVESDGSTVFATYMHGKVIESGAFEATFLRSDTDAIEGKGFLSILH
jgi:hypothetical protein